MTDSIQRSIDILKTSFWVIYEDMEILLYAFLSIVINLSIAVLGYVFVLYPLVNAGVSENAKIINFYILFAVFYFLSAFVMTFFNVCIVYTAKKRFLMEDATFLESLKYAFSKIHLISAWSVVYASFGILLKIILMLSSRLPILGRIIVMMFLKIFELGWDIITIFIVPCMVYENLGPFSSIRRSVEVLKKTWGENIVKYVGFSIGGFIFKLIFFAFIFVFIFLSMILQDPAFILLGIFIAYLTAFIFGVIMYVAKLIFNTALYVYASTGKVPGRFSYSNMRTAFETNEVRSYY